MNDSPVRIELAPCYKRMGSTISSVIAFAICLQRIWRRRLCRLLAFIALRITRSPRRKRQREFVPTNLRRVIVWAVSDGLGDAVNSIPMIRALKSNFSSPYLAILCRNGASCAVYSQLPEVDEVIRPPLSVAISRAFNRAFLRRIRSGKYDLLVQDPISWQSLFPSSFIYSMFSRIPYKVGYFCLSTALFNTWILFPKSGVHTSEMKLRLIEEILGEAVTPDRRFPVSRHARFWGNQRLKAIFPNQYRHLVGFHVGASDLVQKVWSVDKFIKLGWLLIDTYGAGIILVGGRDELVKGREILDAIEGHVYDYIGCNIDQTAAILEQCDLFVGNDSGPMHIAASVGTPVVALFGPTNYTRCHPHGVPNKLVRAGLPCSPCWCWLYDYERHERLAAKRNKCLPPKCMEAIHVEEVFSACAAFLCKVSPVLAKPR